MTKKNRPQPEIQYLWPTPILSTHIGRHKKLNKALLALFYQHRLKHEAQKRAVYASSDDLYERYKDNAAIEQLTGFIMDGIFEIALC